MQVRDATETDLPMILAIYNEIIANTTAVYSEEPVTLDDRKAWWRGRVEQRYPVLVALDSSGISGFATFGDFRAWPCYRHTVEHSVHVRADCRGQGVGKLLMTELFPRAAGLGKHVMIAGIDAANSASIGMHESLGFERVAHFREVGHKFGRWLDLVFLQRWIDARGARSAAPNGEPG
jgi:phosphinothricin acetyltransferase